MEDKITFRKAEKTDAEEKFFITKVCAGRMRKKSIECINIIFEV
jgi:hypothetical protein